MQSPKFQLNKVRRTIKTQGVWLTFKKEGKNDFGEPNGVVVSTIEIKGVYHETTSYLKKSTTDSATVRKKPCPMFLCLYEAAQLITTEYTCTINGKKYTLGEVKNISEANLVCDISLEEVQE